MKKALSLALLAGAFLATSAQAVIIDITQPNTTLASVLGNQFLVGDKLFTVPANAFQSVAFQANQIFISPLIAADPLVGQGFRLSGAFIDPPTGGSSDFVFAYDVEITAPFIAAGYRIHDATLAFNGFATGSGSFSRVDETIMNANLQLLDNASVYNIAGNGVRLQDVRFFDGYTRLHLVKDVHFFANPSVNGNGPSTAGASFIDQTFSQVIIPLPTTAGLAMVGMGVTALRRRR